MNQPICYVNGKFVPADQAELPASDLGVLRGYGVFDLLRTYHKKPFTLNEHLQRLQNSARLIGIELPWTMDELTRIVNETVKRNDLPDLVIRIVVTGGASNDSITPLGKPSLMVLIHPLPKIPKEWYENGIKVITVPSRRAIPLAKTVNYVPAILALQKAKAANAVEALYTDEQNHVLEGTVTNFFAFKGAQLITAKEGVLLGITRGVVLDLAKTKGLAEKKFQVVERALALDELKEIDEAFITASNREIVPVTQINDLRVGDGEPGPNTATLMKLFREFTNA